MRKIEKGKEPASWTQHRMTRGAIYERTDDLARALCDEQGYLCAYCQTRIKIADSRIEHIRCRAKYPKLQLDYQNMVLCCNGETNGESHCDVSKGDKDIRFSPLDQRCIDTLSYSSNDGRIISSDLTYNEELNKVLNLNHSSLKLNRKQALDGVVRLLEKRGKWTKKNIQKCIKHFESRDDKRHFTPYNGIVLWFLSKHLRI